VGHSADNFEVFWDLSDWLGFPNQGKNKERQRRVTSAAHNMTIEPKISGMVPTYVDPLSVETHTDFFFLHFIAFLFLHTKNSYTQHGLKR